MSQSISIRNSLLRGQIVVVLLLGAALLGASYVGARQALSTLLSALVERQVDHVETELRRFFQPLGGGLVAAGAWGRIGLLSVQRPDDAVALLGPLFQQQPQLWRILVIDAGGSGISLVRSGAGEEIEVGSVRASADSDWWLGASGLLEDPRRSIFVASPQPLEQEAVVGLTGSVAFRELSGDITVVAFQVQLEGVVRFVRDLELTGRDAIAVLTDDFRVLAMSDDRRLWRGSERGWVLKRPSELGSSLVTDGIAAFALRSEDADGPLQFLHRGELWWAQVRPFELGGESLLYISVLVPDAELGAERRLIRGSILAVTAAALLFAVLGSLRLSRGVSEPIEVLVRNSERIRRGDLEAGQPVISRLREVEVLAAAQERLREGLRTLLKLKGDLQVARRIQRSSLPNELPSIPGWELAAWSEPAEETGGDAYDAIVLGESSSSAGVLLLLADATGHGIGAALSAARFTAMVRIGVRAGYDLAKLVALLDQQLREELPGNRFVSAWLGRIEPGGIELVSLSAGQAPLLWLRRGEHRAEILGADVPPLGLPRATPIATPRVLEMERGDLFVAVSDGFHEAINAAGEELGIGRLAAVLEREREGTAAEILLMLRREVEAFTAGMPAGDDRTAVVIRKTGAM